MAPGICSCRLHSTTTTWARTPIAWWWAPMRTSTPLRQRPMFTGNIAYNLPVEWGPISHLTFYNDYSLITDKSANLADTWMNVTGVSITAGGLFAYLDILNGKNQPFLGGTMDNEHSGRHNRRLNLNLGYYF